MDIDSSKANIWMSARPPSRLTIICLCMFWGLIMSRLIYIEVVTNTLYKWLY